MAYSLHSIGVFEFIALNGEIQFPRPNSEVIARPNVEGALIRVSRSHPEPFALVSTRDVSGEFEGADLYRQYLNLINLDPVTIIKNNVNYFIQWGWRAKVLSVGLVDLAPKLKMAGKIFNTNSNQILTCEWSLILV